MVKNEGNAVQILHTADVHLRQDDSETVEALEGVLNQAESNNVDLLTIGGDLFDTPEDAEVLRPQLRDSFRDNSFDILAIPGNHDEDVYRENLRFGNDLGILTETPCSTVEFGDVEIVGVPFTSAMTEELYSILEGTSSGRTRILLLHCTLDIGFRSGEVGEDEGRYFPVTKATLAELGFDYVLAGHVHSKVREVPLDNGGTFIYPGSPVSHSTKEQGPRNAVLLDVETDQVSEIPLDSYYFDSLSSLVRPGTEEESLEEIDEWVARREDDNCELEITVDGFTEYGEEEFHEELEAAAAPVEPRDNTQTVARVIDHPLYQRFVERLDERDDVDDEMVETRVLQVLSRLISQNKVQPT